MAVSEGSLKVAGLFAGIGGFELGLSASGFSTRLLCEIDTAAQAVLRTQFPHVELASDIRALDAIPDDVNVLTAGFPCQDLSSVGQKEGIRGTRSSIVEEVFRLLTARQPEWVIIENVHFMLHLNKGAGIRTIVTKLEELEYKWAYRVLDSSAFGLPQRRRRVFVVASKNNDPRNVLLSGDAPRTDGRTFSLDKPIGFYWTEGTYATGLAANAVPPLKGGSTIGIPSPPAVLLSSGLVGTPDIRDAERLQGFGADWTASAAQDHKPSSRWKLVGNAVSVNVAAWLGRRIKNPVPYDSANDTEIIGNSTWPNAAWNLGEGRFASAVSERPEHIECPGLDAFLKHDLKPLSKKATLGFLKRARKGNLRYPEGFLSTLDQHAASFA